jgi:hypothetical protein
VDDRNARFIKFLQDVGVIDPTMPDPLADITGVQRASITHPNEDIDKNLLDIANFCMMIWNRRQYEETLPLQEVRPGLDEGV